MTASGGVLESLNPDQPPTTDWLTASDGSCMEEAQGNELS